MKQVFEFYCHKATPADGIDLCSTCSAPLVIDEANSKDTVNNIQEEDKEFFRSMAVFSAILSLGIIALILTVDLVKYRSPATTGDIARELRSAELVGPVALAQLQTSLRVTPQLSHGQLLGMKHAAIAAQEHADAKAKERDEAAYVARLLQ